jgi:hypothetical protein
VKRKQDGKRLCRKPFASWSSRGSAEGRALGKTPTAEEVDAATAAFEAEF